MTRRWSRSHPVHVRALAGSFVPERCVCRSGSACANTLRAALGQAEHGVDAQRTLRFRHTGNLQAKFTKVRKVLGMTINCQQHFKQLADSLALEPVREGTCRFLKLSRTSGGSCRP
jgi:Domain of unknown function (DUF932)